MNAVGAMYRARALRAIPKWANLDEIKAVYLEATRAGKHVDHIIPLAGDTVCGLHVANNLRLLDPIENIKKSNKFDPTEHEWSRADAIQTLHATFVAVRSAGIA